MHFSFMKMSAFVQNQLIFFDNNRKLGCHYFLAFECHNLFFGCNILDGLIRNKQTINNIKVLKSAKSLRPNNSQTSSQDYSTITNLKTSCSKPFATAHLGR